MVLSVISACVRWSAIAPEEWPGWRRNGRGQQRLGGGASAKQRILIKKACGGGAADSLHCGRTLPAAAHLRARTSPRRSSWRKPSGAASRFPARTGHLSGSVLWSRAESPRSTRRRPMRSSWRTPSPQRSRWCRLGRTRRTAREGGGGGGEESSAKGEIGERGMWHRSAGARELLLYGAARTRPAAELTNAELLAAELILNI